MRKEKVVKQVFGSESALTPSDVLNKEFRRALAGGYNTNEVDEFLEQVAETLEALIGQLRSLKEEIEQHKERLEEYRQMEASLRNALVSSQKFGENILESAKREANVLLEEAHMKQAQAQLEVAKIPAALSQDILLLQQQRSRLRVEMMAILATHKNLLDSLIPLETEKRPSGLFEVGSAASEPESRVPPDLVSAIRFPEETQTADSSEPYYVAGRDAGAPSAPSAPSGKAALASDTRAADQGSPL